MKLKVMHTIKQEAKVQRGQRPGLVPGGQRQGQAWSQSSASPSSLRISAPSGPLLCSLWVASWSLTSLACLQGQGTHSQAALSLGLSPFLFS